MTEANHGNFVLVPSALTPSFMCGLQDPDGEQHCISTQTIECNCLRKQLSVIIHLRKSAACIYMSACMRILSRSCDRLSSWSTSICFNNKQEMTEKLSGREEQGGVCHLKKYMQSKNGEKKKKSRTGLITL